MASSLEDDGRVACRTEARLPPAPIVRPPLAASQPKHASVPRQFHISGGRVPATTQAVAPKAKKAARSNKTAQNAGHAPAGAETMPGPSLSTSQNDGWMVVKRGKKPSGRKMTTTASQHQAVNMSTKRTRKLQPPKSAAVVVTILPEAASKGLSYPAVFKKARDTLAS
ncbi:unnamed protein product [Leptidea sinapis]|uniref:Uncharacterized protein n=1 Tax=Leptidea sinapis TaxID=189913 RepID=A0A5E4PSE4_9NEOP|nr:unnamed protein product [Leptidea sinapis]